MKNTEIKVNHNYSIFIDSETKEVNFIYNYKNSSTAYVCCYAESIKEWNDYIIRNASPVVYDNPHYVPLYIQKIVNKMCFKLLK